MDKKGFLFTVTVFLILTYILLSISVWVKGIETSERAYSEFYKESTVELAIEQISPPKIDNITNMIMNRALFRLNKQSIDSPVLPGPSGDENMYINDSLYSLLVNGNASGSDFQGSPNNLPDDGSSLGDWVSNLNASLLAIGVYVSDFQVSNFNAWQGDINTVNYSFDLVLDLNDYSNTSSVTRTYHINNAVDITGLVDPALARGSAKLAGDQSTVYREFFFDKTNYSSSGSIRITRLDTRVHATEGEGWLYDSLASASPSSDPLLPNASDVDFSQRGNYILVGSFDDITNLGSGVYDNFAGYILTNSPGVSGKCTAQSSTYDDQTGTFRPLLYSGSSCTPSIAPGEAVTEKPFIVAPGFDASDAPECPIFSGSPTTHGRCALITNKWLGLDVTRHPLEKLDNSASAIYGVEEMRDFVMCGYYTQDPAAPSYFQRLLPDSYSRNDSVLGIETFVIGEYANSTIYDLHSRLDRELLSSTSVAGIKIMGLPGCRNYETCADTPTTGIFTVSPDTATAYGLGSLECSGTRCG